MAILFVLPELVKRGNSISRMRRIESSFALHDDSRREIKYSPPARIY
jgi:hypothetical protein